MSDTQEDFPQPEYSDAGVDLSLIRWALSLSPAERLESADELLADVEYLLRNVTT